MGDGGRTGRAGHSSSVADYRRQGTTRVAGDQNGAGRTGVEVAQPIVLYQILEVQGTQMELRALFSCGTHDRATYSGREMIQGGKKRGENRNPPGNKRRAAPDRIWQSRQNCSVRTGQEREENERQDVSFRKTVKDRQARIADAVAVAQGMRKEGTNSETWIF